MLDRIDSILDCLKNEYNMCLTIHNNFMVKFGFLITIEGFYYSEIISKLKITNDLTIVTALNIGVFLFFLISLYYVLGCFKGNIYGTISLDNFEDGSEFYSKWKYSDEGINKAIIFAYIKVIRTEKEARQNLHTKFSDSIKFFRISVCLYLISMVITI